MLAHGDAAAPGPGDAARPAVGDAAAPRLGDAAGPAFGDSVTTELDVLDLLARLVDRSLVVVADAPTGMRYRLLESVSEYCRARMSDAGELDRVRLAHLRHYLELAERAEPELYAHDQRDWLLRLDAEAANMRAALDTAVAHADAGAAARLVNALAWYWFLRGRLAEARRSLETALSVPVSAPAAPGTGAVRARAAAWQAAFALLAGEHVDWRPVLEAVPDRRERARVEVFVGMHVEDIATGQELTERSLATFREVGDKWGVAVALVRHAMDAFTRRDHEALERIGTESARLFIELGDRWGLLRATEWLASLAEMRKDAEQAARLFGEGLRMAEDLGLWPEVASHTAWLGWVALGKGDYDTAIEICERALKLATAQGYSRNTSMAEMGLAFAARRAGRYDLAEKHLNHLLEGLSRDPGGDFAMHLPDTLIELGYLTELRGDADAAMRLHMEALGLARKVGDPATTVFAVEGAAAAARPEQAARLLGLADAVRRHNQTPVGLSERHDIDRAASRARAALGDEAFEAAYAQGAAGKLDDVEKLL
ncbi:tetratricopeptide repeat protein [Nonomuraea terrae]|uniref:Tetratricopeptide repeat protein n=2 Tax=Nonomuraea terrae TaxID=2530383 RepID=A0A4R4XRY5_9ACTN|nr:tetratricopeptide repeat protein [Nonomuraea terrae]